MVEENGAHSPTALLAKEQSSQKGVECISMEEKNQFPRDQNVNSFLVFLLTGFHFHFKAGLHRVPFSQSNLSTDVQTQIKEIILSCVLISP